MALAMKSVDVNNTRQPPIDAHCPLLAIQRPHRAGTPTSYYRTAPPPPSRRRQSFSV